MITTAYAQDIEATTTAATTDPADTPPPAGMFSNPMMMFVFIIAIFYFVMIRPSMRKEKERKKQIETLRAGTRIMFSGGIVGTIDEVKDHTFRVRVAEHTIIEIARGAVNSVLSESSASAEVR